MTINDTRLQNQEQPMEEINELEEAQEESKMLEKSEIKEEEQNVQSLIDSSDTEEVEIENIKVEGPKLGKLTPKISPKMSNWIRWGLIAIGCLLIIYASAKFFGRYAI